MNEEFATYIMASKRNGTLYVGMTSDLVARVFQHRNKTVDGFTQKYNVTSLVYYHTHGSAHEAIYAEKKLKKLGRLQKITLIETYNPYWRDLYGELV